MAQAAPRQATPPLADAVVLCACAVAALLAVAPRLGAAPLAAPNAEISEADASAACLPAFADAPVDLTCRVAKFARVGLVHAHTFSYALYRYQTKDGVVLNTRVVIFERTPARTLRVLFAPDSDGGTFQTPKLLRTRAGVLLHIPGSESGTGNFNRERLYIWRGARWHPVDTTAWLKALAKRLPNGLGAWKGIYPDYRTMRAQTPLWREKTDGNCCPTGGRADLRLAWLGNRITLAGVRVRRHANQ